MADHELSRYEEAKPWGRDAGLSGSEGAFAAASIEECRLSHRALWQVASWWRARRDRRTEIRGVWIRRARGHLRKPRARARYHGNELDLVTRGQSQTLGPDEILCR